jgi:hypothetical protein
MMLEWPSIAALTSTAPPGRSGPTTRSLRCRALGDDVCVVTNATVLNEWLAGRDDQDLAEPFTFVIDLNGELRIAPRRSEHVACAEGHAVLSAGEMTFRHDTPHIRH